MEGVSTAGNIAYRGVSSPTDLKKAVEKIVNKEVGEIVDHFYHSQLDAETELLHLLLKENKGFEANEMEIEPNSVIDWVLDKNTRNILAQLQSEEVFNMLYSTRGSKGPISDLHFVINEFLNYSLVCTNMDNGNLADGIIATSDGARFNIAECRNLAENFLHCAILAAENDTLPNHALRLAKVFESGLGELIPKDTEKAGWYYLMAAKKGSVEAKLKICELIGVEPKNFLQ